MSNEDKKDLPAKVGDKDLTQLESSDDIIISVERPDGSEEIQIPEIVLYETEKEKEVRAISASKQEFENNALRTENLLLKRMQNAHISYMNSQTRMIAEGSDLTNKRILNIGRAQATIRNAIDELNAPRNNFLIMVGIAIFVLVAYAVSSSPETSITITNLETNAQTQVFFALIVASLFAAAYMFLKYKRRI